MKRGAYTYLTKPFDARELALQVERALENRRLTCEISRLKGLLTDRYEFENIVARSAPMQRVLEVVSRIATNDSTVYVSGESGTGKEVIARAVHFASGRKDKPFVAINCAALPETLLESALFGHEKGAFTGAIRSSKGLFTQAHGGTIFLDEIGDMPLSIQAKFLRVLQERQFHPVGGATADRGGRAGHRRHEQKPGGTCQSGPVPRRPLLPDPCHPHCAPCLAGEERGHSATRRDFLKAIQHADEKRGEGPDPAALQRLMFHDWPGNVRELENTIEYAVAMTVRDVLTEDLILPAKSSEAPETAKPLKEAKGAFEKSYLVRLLELSRGNVSSAATQAGKYRADFYALLKKHGLNPGDFKK